MDTTLLFEYAWVLLILIALEGILAADNALVMAVMVKHLPEEKRKKALFYGLAGAFVFRLASLFLISFLVDVWQVQAIGALYLIFLALNHVFRKFVMQQGKKEKVEKKNQSGFWMTVLKVELADIAFAVDSILAAVALAVTLPRTNLPAIGGLDGGQFLVIFSGGLIGLIIIRFAANYFVNLLHRRPGLETAAYLVVGWVGVKLAIYTLSHPEIGYLPEAFVKSPTWKITFWGVLLALFIGGWFLSKEGSDEPEIPEKDLDQAENDIEEAEKKFDKRGKVR
jgi:YkoY family integral membrane protein